MFQWFNWLSEWTACSTIVTKFGCLALFQNLLKSEIKAFFEMIYLEKPVWLNIVVRFIRNYKVFVLKL